MIVGRIVADNDEKMTETSVMLEASRAGGSGLRIPLDLSSCPSYAFFPGQLVALEGRNPDGTRFIVSRQLANKCLAPPMPAANQSTGPASVMVAAGPFSLDGALDFAPIDKLFLAALERTPDLLILVQSNVITSTLTLCRWDRLWMLRTRR